MHHSLNELSNKAFESPEEIVELGDKINVYVITLEDKDGNVILSKKKLTKSMHGFNRRIL